MQVPPSVFDGREPVTVTEYEYDGDGRITRSVATTESAWTEVDRAEMFALAEFRSSILCPCGCGFLAADTLANEKLGPVPTFTATRVVCRARAARLEAAAGVDDPKKPPPPSAGARIWTTTMNRKGITSPL
jgi:hypothetical protein